MPKGPKGEKRPADVIGAAVMVAKIATGEIEDNPAKTRRAEGGKVGGIARAKALPASERRRIAKAASESRWHHEGANRAIDFNDAASYIDGMSDATNQSIAAALQEKLNEVLARRARNEKLKAALASEDLAIDRDLADLRAAVRVLGAPLEIPETEKKGSPTLLWNTSILRTLWPHTEGQGDEAPPLPLESVLGRDPHPPQDTAVSTRPPIKDIVLARLKEAGDEGSGATAIRKYIEQVYGEIHKKTVGMTLYRLSKDGLVRRHGNTWFLVTPEGAETRNPGVSAPGSFEDEL